MLLDHRLPDMTGLDFLQHLTNRVAGPLAVVYITSFGDEEIASQAIQLGAHDYVPKIKLSPQRLQRAIAQALEKADLQHRLRIERIQLQTATRQLQRQNETLEMLIAQRTRDLQQINERLKYEVHQHQITSADLAAQEARYRRMIGSLREGVWIVDSSGVTVFANPQMGAILGVPNLNGMPFSTFWTGDPADFRAFLYDLIAAHEHQLTRLRQADGSIIWGWLSASPYERVDNATSTILLTFVDTTRQVEAEAHSRERDRLLNVLYDSSADTLLLVEESTRILRVNRTAQAMFGYSEAEFLEILSTDLMADWNPERDAAIRAQIAAGITTACVLFKRKDGSTFWGEFTTAAIYNDATQYSISIRDITERLQAEETLALRNQALDAANVGIVICDARRGNAVIYANESFVQLTGYSQAETLGRNLRFLQGDDNQQPNLGILRDALDRGDACRVLLLNYTKDGVPFWNDLLIAPIRSERGELTHFVGIQNDVTERIQIEHELLALNATLESQVAGRMYELKMAHDRLQQALAAEALIKETRHHLMMTISHEFRTPIAVIQLAAEALKKYAGRLSAEQFDTRVEQIIEQCLHLGRLIDDTQTMYQANVSGLKYQPKSIDLRHELERLFTDIIALFGRRQPDIHLQVELTEATVWVDWALLYPILHNLLTNAVKYSARGQAVWLRAFSAADTLQLVVEDHGMGIAPEHRERIFEPFFRGANSGQTTGLGLGLAIVRQAVDAYPNARLTFESTVERGTIFTLTLPYRLYRESFAE